MKIHRLIIIQTIEDISYANYLCHVEDTLFTCNYEKTGRKLEVLQEFAIAVRDIVWKRKVVVCSYKLTHVCRIIATNYVFFLNVVNITYHTVLTSKYLVLSTCVPF